MVITWMIVLFLRMKIVLIMHQFKTYPNSSYLRTKVTSKNIMAYALTIFYADPHDTPRQETWNYCSIIGKFNILAQNTRPGISFVVYQCAGFCSRPSSAFELAVKSIIQYLIHIKDEGLILHPTRDFTLDMYIDANFAGLWHQQHSALHESVLSCTGYVITYCSCPIHRVNKFQSEIAPSTTESKYITLSIATRELLTLRQFLHEIHQHGIVYISLDAHFNTTKTMSLAITMIYKDNASCIVHTKSEGNKTHCPNVAPLQRSN
jgi:hypothetical protein